MDSLNIKKLFYCEECQNLVPENECQDQFKIGKISHTYMKLVNAYGDQPLGQIGCCLIEQKVYCGEVREPTDQEYFLYRISK